MPQQMAPLWQTGIWEWPLICRHNRFLCPYYSTEVLDGQVRSLLGCSSLWGQQGDLTPSPSLAPLRTVQRSPTRRGETDGDINIRPKRLGGLSRLPNADCGAVRSPLCVWGRLQCTTLADSDIMFAPNLNCTALRQGRLNWRFSHALARMCSVTVLRMTYPGYCPISGPGPSTRLSN